jgi:molecular chaperone HscB
MLHFARPLLQFRFYHPIRSILRPNKCPNCATTLPSPLPACTNCWHIYPLPSNTRLHDIFGLPYQPNPFAVDVATLKQKFREAQAICHPDSWASRGSVRL